VGAPPQAIGLFETPLIIDQMPGFPELNRDLTAAILARKAEHPGLEISNVGGWHSDTQMLAWGGESARRLVERIIGCIDYYTTDIRAAKDSPRYKWYPEMWANVSPPGASNQFHSHPGAFWSAVYYVDDGYAGSPDQSLGGELILLDPRMPAVRMAAPDLRFRRPGQQPDQHEKLIRPAGGRIVIFPAWLSHAVRPYRGRGTRISIAVNLSAIPVSISPEGQPRPA
jgi:uncharacterized protein (TIGR02466 family)